MAKRTDNENAALKSYQSKYRRKVLVTYLKSHPAMKHVQIHAGVENRILKRMLLQARPDLENDLGKLAPKQFVEKAAEIVAPLVKIEQGIVYIIGNREKELCKIGRSIKPENRLKALQTGCPFTLEILALFEDRGPVFEKALHERAKPYHERGEWFRIAGRLKDYLDALCKKE